jgi:hypothetical protein
MKFALAAVAAALLIPATSASAHARVGGPPPDPSIQCATTPPRCVARRC